ncbi:MAG: transposase [Planctomycetes bacterium]|nr:transposase [Planctomycetota bacterium]MBI3847234.1 transposase [Planctomycetota bacterium]
MGRPRRYDEPGMWSHVVNHAVGDLVVFETDADFRFFFSLIAREVNRGRLRVYAFAVLSNHFHLMVSSPTCELSKAMQRIESEYAQVYNWLRGRQGPLFCGRFWSKPAMTVIYRRVLVRYMDLNPVRAGLSSTAAEYPYCSARWYATRRGPRWLDREWVESEVRAVAGGESYDPAAYGKAFGSGSTDDIEFLVNRRLWRKKREPDPLDDLIANGTSRVREWLTRDMLGARRATSSIPVAAAGAVERAIVAAIGIDGAAPLPPGRVRIALLRDLCGFTFSEIANQLGVPRTTTQDAYQEHARAMRQNSNYAERIADVATEAIRTTVSSVVWGLTPLDGRVLPSSGV